MYPKKRTGTQIAMRELTKQAEGMERRSGHHSVLCSAERWKHGRARTVQKARPKKRSTGTAVPCISVYTALDLGKEMHLCR